jgi:hypothetical protein
LGGIEQAGSLQNLFFVILNIVKYLKLPKNTWILRGVKNDNTPQFER